MAEKANPRRAAFFHECDELQKWAELTKQRYTEAFKIVLKSGAPAIFGQTQTPPEPEMLFDGIHKGKYVYVSKEGKTRTTKIVFPL